MLIITQRKLRTESRTDCLYLFVLICLTKYNNFIRGFENPMLE